MPEPLERSGNLPAELTSFIGRRRELADTRQLLTESRLVTLTGVGGVGKTRLALQAGTGVRRAFPDGVWFVRLAELRDPALLPNTVAAELGLRGRSSGQVSGLAEYLDDKRLLLILDNCEHLVSACAALAAKLLSAAGGVRILVTSRQVLRAEGERVLHVPPLSVPEEGEHGAPGESVALFADRAAMALPGFTLDDTNRAGVSSICRRLEGIPLAIELAAVWVRVLSVEQILHRLDDRFRLLTSGSRTVLPRQRTLEATIAWSYELCTPEEQAVWMVTSVLAGGFDLDGAEAVCAGEEGIIRADVLDVVAGLVDKSILIRSDGTYGRTAWYRMLENVREYGLLKLGQSGRTDAVRMRYVAYCRSLSEQHLAECFSPRQLDSVRRLTREHASLRGALQYCLEDRSRVRYATEIASQLWKFWYAAGHVPEGRHWLSQALALDTEPSRARAYALEVCCSMTWNVPRAGGADVAEVLLAELCTLAERFDDDPLRAGCALCSGMGRFFAGDLMGAREQFEVALRLFEAADDVMQVFITLISLSVVAFYLADPAGEEFAAKALSLCETHQAMWSRNYALWVVAINEWRRGDHRRAAARLREAIATWFSDRTQLAYVLSALAWCADAAGEHERVAGLLGAARAVWRLSGARAGENSPYHVFDEQCGKRAQLAMGTEAYAATFGAGAGFGIDEAIAYALAEKPKTEPAAAGRGRGAPGGLTRREWEIAELVAEGLSNRTIAERLVISQRTAETHVQNTLVKLGFTSRAQIAAWLAEQRAGEH